MAGFVDSTVKDIEGRLQELKEEVTKLEAAREALVGTIRRGPGRPRSTGGASPSSSSSSSASTASSSTRSAKAAPKPRARRGPGRPRGRRGGDTRYSQALELVRKQPGVTIPEIAEALKIEPNYLYRVMPKLVSDGVVTREGQGWNPVAAKASASAGA
jgi:hypothetical protein